MSVLNKNPYLNSVLSDLDKSELTTLLTLINGSSSFVYRSLVDGSALLTESDNLKAINLQLAKNIPSKAGWFFGETFIEFFYNRPEMLVYKIDLSKNTYELINEPLTATDLRQIIGDKIADLEVADVTAADINSGEATAGQVLMANGSGKASWQNIPISVGDAINLGAIVVGTLEETNLASFYKEVTDAEWTAISDTGLAVLMFNTTCVIFPFVKAYENRFVINAIAYNNGGTMVVRAKLRFDGSGPKSIAITFEEAYADALVANTDVRPYAIIKFIKLG